MLSRRSFLASGLTMLSAPRLFARAVRVNPGFHTNPFTLGVASGDPAHDGVVLWTRLAPDPLNGGGMGPDPVSVQWEIADDQRMTKIVQRGSAIADPALAHSVHVEVSGLRPDRWYWYRFMAGNASTEPARTRTVPAERATVDRLRFAFASCQYWESGYYTAYHHMAQEDIDLVFHLGDYIYEGPAREGVVRPHIGVTLMTLDQYRGRYAQYKMDPHLQAAHAACPWIVTWDDHDVADNYASLTSRRNDPIEQFRLRRAAAYQAYYEHQPLRRASLPHAADAQMYRSFAYGSLASFFVLDTRQYRSPQACGNGVKPVCDGIFDPNMTMMGSTQEKWLLEGFSGSRKPWNVIPQQVMMAPVDLEPGPGVTLSTDQWSGYDVARTRLLKFFETQQARNPIVLSGDIHNNWVNDLKADFRNPHSATVATEFVGTSITSGGDGSDLPDSMVPVLAENPFVRFHNDQRGYVRCDVTLENFRADYRVVPFVTREGATIGTRASFVVEAGRPGAQRAGGT
jgi:alkaline phosphatase D